MANGNKITYTVGFNTDMSGLNKALDSLKKLSTLVASDIMISPEYNQAAAQQLSRDMVKARKDAKLVEDALKTAYNPALGTTNINKFNTELLKSGKTLQDVSKSLSVFGEEGVKANTNIMNQLTKLDTTLYKTSGFLDKMASSFANIARYQINTMAFRSLTGTISSAVSYAKELDKSLNNIQIVTGKSSQYMQSFAKEANELAKALGTTTTKYTDASLIYFQQGLDEDTVKKYTDVTLKVANVTKQSVENVSEELTAVWNGYKVATDEAEAYVDKLAAVAATSASNLEELATAMSKVAATASTVGVDFDDLTAQISTIVSVTRQAPESVGTALKTIYARLGDLKIDGVDENGVALGTVSAQMEEMGIRILDAQGQMRDMSSIIMDTAEKWNTWTMAQKQAAAIAMAGKRQYTMLMSLFENWDMHEKEMGIAADSLGELSKQQDIYTSSVEAAQNALEATSESLKSDILSSSDLTNYYSGLTRIVEVIDDMAKSFGGLSGILKTMAPLLLTIMSGKIANFANNMVGNLALLSNKKDAQQDAQILATGGNENQVRSMEYANSTREQMTKGNLSDDEVAQRQKILETYNELISKEQQYLDLKDKEVAQEEALNKLGLDREKIEEKMREIAETTSDVPEDDLFTVVIDDAFENSMQSLLSEEAEQELEEQINHNIECIEKYKEEIAFWKDVDDKATSDLTIALKDQEKALENNQKRFEENKKAVLENKAARQQALAILPSEKKNMESNADAIARYNLVLEQTKKNDAFKEMSSSALKASSSIILLNNSIGNMAKSLGEGKLSITGFITQLALIGPTLVTVITALKKFKESTIAFDLAKITIKKITQTAIDEETKKLINLSKEEFEEKLKTEATTRAKQEEIKNRLANAAAIDKESKAKEKLEQMSKSGDVNASVKDQAGKLSDYFNGQSKMSALGKAKEGLKTGWSSGGLKGALKGGLSGLGGGSALAGAATAAMGVAAAGAAVYAGYQAYQKYQIGKQIKETEQQIKDLDASIEKVNESLKDTESIRSFSDELLNLDQQLQDGSLSREQLRFQIDDLLDKYEIEDEKIRILINSYDDLKAASLAAQQEVSARNEQDYDQLKDDKTDKAHATLVQTWMNDDRISSWNKTGSDSTLFNLHDLAGYEQENDEKIMGEWQKLAKEYKLIKSGEDATKDIDLDKVKIEGLAHAWEDLAEFAKEEDLRGSDLYQAMSEYLSPLVELQKEIDEAADKGEEASEEKAKLEKQLAIVTAKTSEEIQNVFNSEIKDAYTDIDDLVNQYITENSAIDSNIAAMVAKSWKQFGAGNLGETLDTFQDLQIDNKAFFDYLITENPDLITKFKSLDELKAYADSWSERSERGEHLQTIDILSEKLSKGYQKLTKDEKESLIALESKYGELAEIRDKSSEQYLNKLKEIREFEEKSNILSSESDVQNSISLLTTLDINSADFEEQLQDLLDKDYQLIVDLKVDADSDVLEINKAFDDINTSISKIGENFIVSRENLSSLSEAFPGILANAKVTAKGEIQLDKQVAEAAIEKARSEAEADKEATKQKLLDKKAYAASMATHYRKLAEFARIMRESENEDDEAYTEAAKGYKTELAAMDATVAAHQQENAEDTNIATQEASKEALDRQLADLENLLGANSEVYGKIAQLRDAALNGDWSTYNALSKELSNWNLSDYIGKEINGKSDYDHATTVKTKVTNIMDVVSQYSGPGYTADEDALTREAEMWESLVAELDGQISMLDLTSESVTTNIKNLGDATDSATKSAEDMAAATKTLDDQLSRLASTLDLLQQKADRLTGQALMDNLNQQVGVIEQENDLLSQRLNMYKSQEAILKSRLGDMGAEFNSDGTISNYYAMYEALHDSDNWSDVSSLIDSYIELFDKINNDSKEILSNTDALIDKRIEKLRISMDANLNLTQLQREFNSFKESIADDDDFTISIAIDKDSVESYTKDIATTSEYLTKIQSEAAKVSSGDYTGMFGDNIVKAKEAVDKALKESETALKGYHDAVKKTHDDYAKLINKLKNGFKEEITALNKVGSQLDHNIKVMQLIYGEQSYDKLASFYEQKVENDKKILIEAKAQMEYWKAQMESTVEGSDEWKVFKENYTEALNEVNKALETSLSTVANRYANKIKEIFKNAENQLTNGMGFNWLSQDFSLQKEVGELYLDNINRAYELNKLQGMYTKSINNFSGSAQKKLTAAMNEQLEILNAKDKLTQYDVERAQKLYDLKVAEIALEEAQNNKNQMMLVRDSQGNYNYQYVADQEGVSEAQDQYNEASKNLWNFDVESYNKSLEQALKYTEEYQQKVQEILNNDYYVEHEEERNAKLLELYDKYSELIIAKSQLNIQQRVELIDDLNTIRESSNADWLLKYGQTADDIVVKTEDLVADMVPTWGGGIEEMIDTIVNEESGFNAIYTKVMTEAGEATQIWRDDVIDACDAAGQSLEDFSSGAVNTTTTDLQNLAAMTGLYNTELATIVTQQGSVVNAVDQIGTAFKNQATDAKNALIAAQEFMSYLLGEEAKTTDKGGALAAIQTGVTNFVDKLNLAKKTVDTSSHQDPTPETFSTPETSPTASSSIASSTTKSHPVSATYSAQGANAAMNNLQEQAMKKASTPTYSDEQLWYNFHGGTFNDYAIFTKNNPTKALASSLSKTEFLDWVKNNVKENKISDGFDGAFQSPNDNFSIVKDTNTGTYFLQVGDFSLAQDGSHTTVLHGDYKDMETKMEKLKSKLPALFGKRGQGKDKKGVPDKSKTFFGFRTGGYTGDWAGQDGRLAVLHQKELVLNAADTQNMLSAVEILRNITNNMNSRLASLSSISAGDVSNVSNTSNSTSNNIVINADFPNASNADEIKRAFDNLTNFATQQVFSNGSTIFKTFN